MPFDPTTKQTMFGGGGRDCLGMGDPHPHLGTLGVLVTLAPVQLSERTTMYSFKMCEVCSFAVNQEAEWINKWGVDLHN